MEVDSECGGIQSRKTLRHNLCAHQASKFIYGKRRGYKNSCLFCGKVQNKGFCVCRMRHMGGRALFYVYHIGALEKLLCCPLNRKFLEERGYPCKSAAQSVRLLKERMQEDDFPHEIGIFLGYPLEDVQGFIDDPTAKTGLCGYWKVYADLEEKQKIFERFRRCTDCICKRMLAGHSLTEIFQVG